LTKLTLFEIIRHVLARTPLHTLLPKSKRSIRTLTHTLITHYFILSITVIEIVFAALLACLPFKRVHTNALTTHAHPSAVAPIRTRFDTAEDGEVFGAVYEMPVDTEGFA
jgi:hypothetical protein